MNTPLTEKQINDAIYQHYTLDKMDIHQDIRIPNHFLRNTSVKVQLDELIDTYIYRFKSYLVGKKHTSTFIDETIKIPASWWDHTKEQFYPLWLLKYFPVNYRNIVVKRVVNTTNICPCIDVPQDQKKCLDFMYSEGL